MRKYYLEKLFKQNPFKKLSSKYLKSLYFIGIFCGYLIGLGVPLIVAYVIWSMTSVINIPDLTMANISYNDFAALLKNMMYLCFQSMLFSSIGTFSLAKYLLSRKQ